MNNSEMQVLQDTAVRLIGIKGEEGGVTNNCLGAAMQLPNIISII